MNISADISKEEISNMTREEIYNKLNENPDLLDLLLAARNAPADTVREIAEMLRVGSEMDSERSGERIM